MFWRAWLYFIYLLVVWTIFRYFSHLPEVVEELWFKSVIWLVPLFWINISVRERVRYFEGGVKRMLVWGGGIGAIYGLLFLILGIEFGQNFSVNVIGVSLVTAVVENLVFAGFLLPMFKERYGKYKSLILTAFLFGAIHLPIAWFTYQLDVIMVLYLFWMTSLLGLVSGWLRLKTGNVGVAILSAWIWSVLVLS